MKTSARLQSALCRLRHALGDCSSAATILPFVIAIGAMAPRPAMACATCGCALSADAAMGYSAGAGWSFNMEYDYIDQSDLRHGSHSASTVPDGNELEHDTTNNYITAGISYSPSSAWNISLRVPYVDRTHSTYGEFDSTQPLPELSTSSSSSLGDMRIVGSYQGLLPTRNLGLQLGLKLPTGQYGTDVKFNGGPLEGEPLDASLQPGMGSTDIIVGAYYYLAISQNFDFFVNGQFQAEVSTHQDQTGSDFKPGNATNISAGLRYEANPRWVPQLQVNVLHKNRDEGALADTENTAGNVVYLSPGITVQVMNRLHVFGFATIPVVSNLDGYQLAPRWTASVGASYGF